MKQIIADISTRLQTVYPADEAEALAWWIAEETTGLSRSQILCGCKGTKNFADMQIFEPIIARLLNFEPIQYIFGHTLWCGLDLKVTPATLIPRPETAELVEAVKVNEKELNVKVLDIGTGSGCIAIALKKRHPEWSVTGIDISPEAIEVAKENARKNDVEIDFRQADIFAQNADYIGHFDIVVSNPPYICEKEKKDMRRNVLEHEPHTALFVPNEDPLLFYRRIAELHLGTHLFFEINEAYSAETVALLDKAGYTDIHIIHDTYGKARIIESRMA